MTSCLKRYRDAVAALESLGVMPDRPPGLETTRAGLARLALPIDPDRVIVVAGTNGKGTVSATLEALLRSAGHTTGLFTSPHLVETTERFRLNGEDVSPELFCLAHERVTELCAGIRLTHFEMLTLMAAWLFFSGEAVPAVDRAVFEVGLGGLWDSTNAVPHRRCVITALGLDHQNLLGDTIVDIARNKFGIVGPGARVVHAPLPEETKALAEEVRRETASHWEPAPACTARVAARDAEGLPGYVIHTPWGEAPLALAGARAAENTAVALAAFAAWGEEPAAHLGALARVRWSGRMNRIAAPGAPCPVFVSGDHNLPGARSLVALLADYRWRRLHVVVGVGRDKDSDGVLGELAALPGALLYLTETPFRGRAVGEYGERWRARAEGAWAAPFDALDAAIAAAAPGDLVLVTGSLYLVGEVLRGRSPQ